MTTVIVNGEPQTIVQVTDDTVNLIQVGVQGPAGPGLPVGGLTGQIPVKLSGTDYAIGWEDVPPASVSWGGIIGTLSNQTDLKLQLDILSARITYGV